MGRVTSRRLVRAPIERVFGLAVRAERFPEWDPFFVAVSEVRGPSDGPPTSFNAVMRVTGHELLTHHVVTLVDPPRAFTIHGVGLAGGRLTWIRRFERAGAAVTVLETELDYELPAGVAVAGIEGVFPEQAIQNDVLRAVDNLAVLAEAATAAVAERCGRSA